MRSIFPGHFRPTVEEFEILWGSCIFAVDANVVLNLYRYSPAARDRFMDVLRSINDHLYLPHHAAAEFLQNRLSVTSNQAKEYQNAIKMLADLEQKLSEKKHPSLEAIDLKKFTELASDLKNKLSTHREALLKRLVNDEVLEFVESVFSGKTGDAFSPEKMQEIYRSGEQRYLDKVPPGYMDGGKDQSGDLQRKFGDLVVWNQIMDISIKLSKPIIFITDDKKEDWWLEHSGKTIGPRPELVEEFISSTKNHFWMYTVDGFLQEIARRNKLDDALDKVIEEAKDIRVEGEATSQAFQIIDSFPAAGQAIKKEEIRNIYIKFNRPVDRSTVPYIVNYYFRQNLIHQWNVSGWIQFEENDTKLLWHINDNLVNDEELHSPNVVNYHSFEIHVGREPAECWLKDRDGNKLQQVIIPVFIKPKEI